jgi:hypothetical protein
MRFWDEMNTKYGFEDGCATPDGIEQYRAVYVEAMNKLLEKHGSECRVIAFNRGGGHNSVLWLRVHKDTLTYLEPEGILYGEHDLDGDEIKTDEGWDKALEEATDLDLDGCVEVKVEINRDHLANILKEVGA